MVPVFPAVQRVSNLLGALINVERRKTPARNKTGKSKTFLLKEILPSKAILKSQRRTKNPTETKRRIFLLNSKKSEVKGKKNRGNKKTKPRRLAFIILAVVNEAEFPLII